MRPISQIMKYTPQSFPKHLYKNSLQDFKPSKEDCLCLIYLNMNHKEDKLHYQHCYRTQINNYKFNPQLK